MKRGASGPSRKAIHAALRVTVLRALSELNLGEGDGTSACRVMRALADCLMDIAVAADAPPGVVAEQIGRVLSRRLSELKPGKLVLIQKEAKA